MIDLTLENEAGLQLKFEFGGPYQLVDADGLEPAGATINTSKNALSDGEKYNSSKVNSRPLLISFTIEYDVEKNRLYVYKVLKPKHKVIVYYKSEFRNVYIDGYVENIEIDRFSMKQTVTVSIKCPYPYFKSINEMITDLDAVTPAFHFPFSISADEPIQFGYIDTVTNAVIQNEGEVTTGAYIEIYSRGIAKNPKIFNYITGEFIGINYDLIAGDYVFINTQSGQKSVTLLRNGIYTNIFNSLMEDITWLQLEPGENVFTCEADEGMTSLSIKFKHAALYEGV